MTIPDKSIPVNEPSYTVFRLTTLAFAILLGVQSVWLSLAELSRPIIDELPTDATSAAAAAQQRDPALWAAVIGVIRGDLWSRSAFTYADLLFGGSNATTNQNLVLTLTRARRSINHALGDAPHQSSVWLLLSGLNLLYPAPGIVPVEALKMSYYTGPSEQNLMPLRLQIATRTDKFDDIEIREFVSRELRLLLARQQNSAITDAYSNASPAGKRFIEQTVSDLNPSFLGTLRAPGAQKQLD